MVGWQCCGVLEELLASYQVLQHLVRCYSILSGVTTSCQVLQHLIRCYKIVFILPRLLHVAPSWASYAPYGVSSSWARRPPPP